METDANEYGRSLVDRKFPTTKLGLADPNRSRQDCETLSSGPAQSSLGMVAYRELEGERAQLWVIAAGLGNSAQHPREFT